MYLFTLNAFSITFPFEQTLSASVYVQSGPLPSQPGTQRPLLWSLLSMESSKKRSVIDLLFRLKRGVSLLFRQNQDNRGKKLFVLVSGLIPSDNEAHISEAQSSLDQTNFFLRVSTFVEMKCSSLF